MDKEIYDVVIVGGGPAGLSAGLYASRAKLKTLIIEKDEIGGRAFTTREIVNYPGVPNTSGPKLTSLMKDQASSFGCLFKKGQVKAYDLNEELKKVNLRKEDIYAKTLILANGTAPRVLGIKGEKEFTGRGVAYCATCDGEFFKDQEIVVLGSGDQAIEESIYLTRFVKKITIVVIHDEGRLDCNKIAKEKAFKNPKIDFIYNSTIDEIYGDDEVRGIKLKNLKTGNISDFKTSGVFMFVGMQANTNGLKESGILNAKDWIITNEQMETSKAGVFACGDVREKFLRQVATAVNDGAIAAISAERYLDELSILDEAFKNKDNILVRFYDSRMQKSIDALSNDRSESDLDIDIAFYNNLKKHYAIEISDDMPLLIKEISK